MPAPPLFVTIALLVALASLVGAAAAWQLADRAVFRQRAAVRVIAAGAALSATVIAGGVAGLHLTGKLGVEQLWFRAPAFFVAIALAILGFVGWCRYVRRPLVRVGIPAAGFVVIAATAFAMRIDGHSTPLPMLMPSLRRAAPELTWTTASGERESIHDLRGKVVLVNFWATWCGPCRHEMPMLSAMQARFGERGLRVVYLSLEDRAVVEPFLRAHPLTGTTAWLESAADYYQAGKFFPLSFLVARDGNIEKRWSGRPTEEWLAESIEAQL